MAVDLTKALAPFKERNAAALAEVDPVLLHSRLAERPRCQLVDYRKFVREDARCKKTADFVGATVCRRGHETYELLCAEHMKVAIEHGEWWRCDVCGKAPKSRTRWERL